MKIDESETSLDDPLILYECLAILNSFLIQFKKSNDVFSVFKADIQKKLNLVIRNACEKHPDPAHQKVTEISLRLLKNLVHQTIITDFEINSGVLAAIPDTELIACLA